ncbi:MAG: protocatechuate 3,4-dioxygenase [Rhodospirillales bacterium]|nr:protocatechuate 3,4-dioxygenase [Rhodospirillales bacterium]
MADIVFGVGCSHSPLLATESEQWNLRAADDAKNPAHWYKGEIHTYDELVKLREDEHIEAQITPEVMRKRHEDNQKHLDFLGQKIKDADLDVLVIFGDDQRENILTDNSPAFLIFNGAEVPFKQTSAARMANMSPGVAVANWARVPDEDMALIGSPELANHIIYNVVQNGFDVSVSDYIAERENAEDGIGHAFGFYYHRLLNDMRDTPDMATLPIYLNTFFAPNQPPLWRCLDFGKEVGRAIRNWDADIRVGIAASGGFSHFVIEEDVDQRLIKAITEHDEDTLRAEPECNLQSGTSEIKNWVAAMGALEGTGLEFQLLDYIPCYRSMAGTGNAMCFGLWN